MAQPRDSLFGVLPTPIALPHPYAQPPEPTRASRRPARRQQSSTTDSGTIYYAPDNTCGFVDGIKSNYFACGEQSTCVIYTSRAGVPGHIMCQYSDHYLLTTACINRGDQCDDDCASNTAKLKCTNTDAPYCNTVDFPSQVTGWMCSSRSNTVPFNAQVTFSGETDRTLSPFKLGQPHSQTQGQSDSSSSTSSAADLSSSSSSSKSLPGFNPTTDTSTETNPTSAPTGAISGGGSSSGHKTNVGAIAGGTVGGVVGLALIGAGLFFFLRRKKKQTPNAQTEAEKKPAVYGGPSQGLAELPSGPAQYPHGAAELYSPEPVYEAPGHPVPRS